MVGGMICVTQPMPHMCVPGNASMKAESRAESYYWIDTGRGLLALRRTNSSLALRPRMLSTSCGLHMGPLTMHKYFCLVQQAVPTRQLFKLVECKAIAVFCDCTCQNMVSTA